MRPDPKRVDSEFMSALAPLGVSFRYGLGSYPIDDSFIGWIGLNIGTHSGFVRINPNIGIHFVPAMKTLASIEGKVYRASQTPTFSVPLGEACPEELQFVVRHQDEVTNEARRLANTIRQFGMPYIGKYATLDALIPRLLALVPALGLSPSLYAICLSLKGERGEALTFVNTHIKEHGAHLNQMQIARMEGVRRFIEQAST